MSDSVDDQGFKLFGRKIPVSDTPQIWDSSGDAAADKPDSASHPNYSQLFIDVSRETEKSDNDDLQMEEICETDKSLGMDHENDQGKDETPTPKDDIPNTDPNLKEEKVETNTSDQEKVVKKPDKILPCPRCNSFDTKFCYYNNYNVNQPRHFCKKCQRYWTAGGTMRNVPVGAGRRKNKHMASHYRHMIIPSNGTPTTQISTLDMVNHPARSCQGFPALSRPSKGSGPVLKVRPDAPLCQSMASALDLEDHKRRVEMGQMVHGDHEEQPSSCGSSAIASISRENEVPPVKQCSAPGFCDRATPPNPLHCYPVPPWFYPWDSGWNNLAATPAGQSSDELVFGPGNGRTELMQSSPKSIVAAPSFCAPIMPYPFVPASYWGFVPSWASNPWNIPWVGSNGSISQPSSSSNSGCSSHGSPSLGKHSRDRNPLGEDTSEKSLWIPKTLRIDDPDEAAKSSIWATLGIKPEQNEQKRKVGPFRAFQPKTEGDYLASDTAKFLQANPAAFSRSQAFQETS